MSHTNNKLSVCMLCKNEQEKLAKCLASITFADEIVVLDSGSTDNSVDVARQFLAKVFIRDDWPGFGEQRRHAEDLTSNDWILMVDGMEGLVS
ncbi:MAG: hypothetical protein CL797_01350 [Chromatiales bacterium]|jgi:(heptosyl)LPS beta-1,4-glucosyltransferase|nr:hypothetical protein [Chromatiales bacterium]